MKHMLLSSGSIATSLQNLYVWRVGYIEVQKHLFNISGVTAL